jgi:hypothetical protein
MNRTFGAPSLARSGSGHAGDETSNVRPMTPLNAAPGLYSFKAIVNSCLNDLTSSVEFSRSVPGTWLWRST